ncbi:MAG: hypothetical protein ACI8Y7_000919 [Candidatus Woesearchaeota archaeon]|jgi:hypothetical protein
MNKRAVAPGMLVMAVFLILASLSAILIFSFIPIILDSFNEEHIGMTSIRTLLGEVQVTQDVMARLGIDQYENTFPMTIQEGTQISFDERKKDEGKVCLYEDEDQIDCLKLPKNTKLTFFKSGDTFADAIKDLQSIDSYTINMRKSKSGKYTFGIIT